MENAPEDVLSFWFGEPAGGAASMGMKFKRWFGGGADFDREIRERFAATVERALSGALDPWAQSVRGRLALILALDQFTRNIFRDDSSASASIHRRRAREGAEPRGRGQFRDPEAPWTFRTARADHLEHELGHPRALDANDDAYTRDGHGPLRHFCT
jgi:uncharacterized protein (DUF924 family)